MLFEKAAANGYNLMPGSIGHFHELVATLVIFWPLLTHFGNLWQLLPMLAIFGNPWQLVAFYVLVILPSFHPSV